MYSAQSKTFWSLSRKLLPPATVFMLSTMVVNGGNYLYNLILGRVLGPEAFAEAGIILTMLLVVSFIGMTFQLVSTKFIAEIDPTAKQGFIQWINKVSLIAGILFMLLIVTFHQNINDFFHLSDQYGVVVLALSLPVYFLMSAKRGVLQGQMNFIQLSGSYQVEIWVKAIITVLLLYIFPQYLGSVLAISILLSIITGSMTCGNTKFGSYQGITTDLKKKIGIFFAYTMGYELLQILINYGDLMMVKHYFDNLTAGLYTSMALIGRMIYFVTWMLVMILIPSVLNKKKQNLPFRPLMYRYFVMILSFSGAIVMLTYFFPTFTVNILFGNEFISLAPILWKYALATALFALANLFIYYFISIEQFLAVYIAGALVAIQFILFINFHQTIEDIVHIQIFTMSILLSSQMILFIRDKVR